MALITSALHRRERRSLTGVWSFSLDPQDVGERDGWLSGSLGHTIQVPGSWEEQGFGDPPVTRPLGAWSKLHNYTGAAWYARDIDTPMEWSGSTVELTLKGARWQSRVWLDGQEIGIRESLSVPHQYDLTAHVKPGKRQHVVIRVDNRLIYPLGDSHINSLETATQWGGITGGIELVARSPIAIDQIKCQPNVSGKRFDFEMAITAPASDLNVEVVISRPDTGTKFTGRAAVSGTSASVSVQLDESARLWWDDDPFLYDAEFTLTQGETALDSVQHRLGLREIQVVGKDILLNGTPVFLRGYVDCCIFPLTGYPSWDIETYRRQLRIARSHGFNHVRFHTWTPPEPFWEAADESGMLVQTELPNWTRQYGYRETDPAQDVHRFLKSELEQIVPALHLHPSWVMFSNGNELIYTNEGHPRLLELAALGKQLDSTRLYTDNTGFGQIPAPNRTVDYFIQSCNWHPPKKIYDAASNDTTEDFEAITALSDRPLIGHEHGQFTMYVRPSEAAKYTGVIRPTWLEAIQETFDRKGMGNRIESYIRASGSHIARTYKENIERARRTRGLSGIQLLDIRDFPGQGHATTGILDVFWDSKGLIEPEVFARFNDPVVLLMRYKQPTLWAGESIKGEIEVSNYGREVIAGQPLRWELRDLQAGTTHSQGHMDVPAAANGQLSRLGSLNIPTPGDGEAHAWEVVVSLGKVTNSWHFWTFPYPGAATDYRAISTRLPALRSALPGAVFSDNYLGLLKEMDSRTRTLRPAWELAITDILSLQLIQYLHDGGTVWLMPAADYLFDHVQTRYVPPFWSYLWFADNVSTVMGTLIHAHPALGRFPHDGTSDWQWYSLFNDAPAICLDSVPHIQPIVEVVDNFNRAKRLCYAFEAQVGAGRLFVSTWRMKDPVVFQRPEGRYLFSEILSYIRSSAFAPTQRLSVGQLLGLVKLTNTERSFFA